MILRLCSGRCLRLKGSCQSELFVLSVLFVVEWQLLVHNLRNLRIRGIGVPCTPYLTTFANLCVLGG